MKVSKQLHVSHPELTIGRVQALGSRTTVRRSGHIGNQNLRELALRSNVKIGLPILVDTIAGDDSYSKPAHVLVGGANHRLASNKMSRNRVVTSLGVASEPYENMIAGHPSLKQLSGHNTISDLHAASLQLLDIDTSPQTTVTELLASLGEIGQALMKELARRGHIRRRVEAGGHITNLVPGKDALQHGIFGQNDSTPTDQGAMLPLEGMMAMDILQAQKAGEDEVFHLASVDMRRYTRDPERMRTVSDIITGAQQRLGQQAVGAHYIVIDITGFDQAVHPDYAAVRSQYDLIEMHANPADRRIPLIDRACELPAYSPMEPPL